MRNIVNGVTELAYLIPEIWSGKLYSELRSKIIFANIFNKDYQGEIRAMGDTVRVNQILKATGEILTDDKQTFGSEQLNVNQYSIVVDKRASAAFEITDLAQLQSQKFEAEVQQALVYAVQKQLENQIISELLPSTSAPDHDIAPAAASDLAAADVAGMRTLLSKQYLPNMERYLVLDPAYYGDIILKQQIASRDYIANTTVTATGAVTDPLFGFTVIEHDGLGSDIGYAVHPSAYTIVMQQDLRVQLSNLHSSHKYGYLVSVDFVFGTKLMDNKRIIKISG